VSEDCIADMTKILLSDYFPKIILRQVTVPERNRKREIKKKQLMFGIFLQEL
jgi:hypothetical protein